MKILQLTNKVPYPPRDGGAIASLALAQGLADAGHDVVLLAMNTTKHFVHVVEAHNNAPLHTIPTIENIQWHIVPVDTRIRWHKALANLLFSRLPYNAVRFISEAYRARLIHLLESEKFDFILLENLYTCLYLDDIEFSCNTHVILRPHNIEHEIWERTAGLSSGLKKLYLKILARRIKRFELSCLNRYEALVPITARDAEQFNRLGNTRPVHVLPPGIQFKETDHTTGSPDQPTVAHLGALDWLPNQAGIRWFLNSVWPLIAVERPDARFCLAGRNVPEAFAAEVRNKGTLFSGEIEDAGAFIREHQVFIVPLFSGSGMRVKLLDYMSLGKPTVSTTIGAEGIPLEPGRDCLVADTPRDFADAVLRLLGSEALRKEIGENAITFVREQYDNRKLISRFTGFLETVK